MRSSLPSSRSESTSLLADGVSSFLSLWRVIHLSIYLYLRTSRALRPCTYPYLSTTTIHDLRVGASYLIATMYARPEHVVELRESHHVLQVEALREAHLWAGYGRARSKRGERPRSPRTAASQEAKGFLVCALLYLYSNSTLRVSTRGLPTTSILRGRPTAC